MLRKCCQLILLALIMVSVAAAEFTISDFNGSGFNYTFAGFQQTEGSTAVRLSDPLDGWGGAGLSLGAVDLSSYANGRLSVDTTVLPGNGTNRFEVELIDVNGNSGKWGFSVASAVVNNPTNFVSFSTLNDPESGIGDFRNLDLSQLRTAQILGDFSGTDPFDMRFSNLLVSNDLVQPPAYPGQEADAPWRAVAASRIDAIRKADINVRVFDAGGARIPNANVQVAMQEHEFGFGSAVVAHRLRSNSSQHAAYKTKVAELFNVATLENNLKWPPWEGEWGSNFTQFGAVAALDWLDQQGIESRGHVLVWPGINNLPNDIQALLEAGPLSSQQQQLVRDRITAHIADITSETNAYIGAWDVLNEPRANHDLMDQLAEGDNAMIDWFHQASNNTNASLYINEYDILSSGGGTNTSSQNSYFDTISFLQAGGAPINGIGLQSHFRESNLTGPEQLWTILDRFESLGLDMQITEFDFNTTDEQLQADYTRDFLTAIFAHGGVDDFLLWGFWEGAQYMPDASLFRTDWSIKPNGQEFIDLVFDQWWTNEELTSDVLGEAMIRAFKGQHVVDVDYNGSLESLDVQLDENGAMLNVVLPVLLGDYNGDGRVGTEDFTIWRDSLGSSTMLAADGNNNGVVDSGDFDLWRNNFGRTANLAVPIPEPATGMLGLIGMLSLMGCRRRVAR